MFNRIKNIFKKSEWNSSSWISFLWWFLWNTTIRDNEYVKFFIGWQYAAITAISDSVSSLNYRLADKNDKDINHEYMNYITPELLQNIAIFMKLCWTAYLWNVSLNNKSLWLSILLPWNLSPNIDSCWNLLSWNYSWNWNIMKLSVEEVLVFAEFNPYERYPYITRWYSPLQALAMTVKWEKEIEDWNYSLLTNDVPPGMILTTDQSLTSEQVWAIKENWERNHTWAKNVGKLAILPFWIKPNNIQASPKEMEFIAQQNWDRDKILAIYKVPKAVLWIWEWVNVWNVKAFNQIYASRCIDPLAKKIARVFNDKLFIWIWTFEFLNVLPSDEDAVREHYLSWWITRNEYRMELWYKPIKWWDVFFDWSEAKIDVKDNNDNIIPNNYWVNYKSIVNKHIKWTEEWMIDRWEQKEIRFVWYENKLKWWLLKVFNKQEKDIISEFEKKWFVSNKAIKLKLDKRFYWVYQLFLKDAVEDIVKSEWERASKEVNAKSPFKYDENIAKQLKEMLTKLAKEVDSVTDTNLLNAIWKAVDEWLSPSETKEVLEGVFEDLKTYRLERIIRTESIRYWTYAEEEARRQSWVVKYKQRWTALDERTCKECWDLHGKKIPLNGKFADDNYWDVIWSPLHPNCRCDMIPVLE